MQCTVARPARTRTLSITKGFHAIELAFWPTSGTALDAINSQKLIRLPVFSPIPV